MHSLSDNVNCVNLARTICIPAMTEATLTVNSPEVQQQICFTKNITILKFTHGRRRKGTGVVQEQ